MILLRPCVNPRELVPFPSRKKQAGEPERLEIA